MNSIGLLLFLWITLLIHPIKTTNLRCYEDIKGSVHLIDQCRACVIFIATNVNTLVSQRQAFADRGLTIEKLFLYEENKRRRRRRRNTKTVIQQKCAREFDGPLYGFDQTHCYCDSHLCNSNIQRCIYEIVSKRYFSCYHGSNSSQNSLEISKKCRSCRIRKESSLTYHYECLTFGEQEQKSETHCTCQHPMCNQDFTICQRFQQIPRVNSMSPILPNTTKTTTMISSISMTFSMTNQTEQELSTENATIIDLTSIAYNETTSTTTVAIVMKNQAKSFSLTFLALFHTLIFHFM